MTGGSVALALLSVALSTWTHGADGCLPDKACEGGLTVTYGSLELECDQDVAKGTATNAPSLRIVGNSQTQGDLLLVMVDPDAPAPEPCPGKYWLHWLAQVKVEVEDTEVKVLNSIIDYQPPTPPVGIHRYQLLVYKLSGEVDQSHVPSGRSGFDLAQFESGVGFGDAVASFQFTVKK